jgi:dTDP-4-dehydrorhamnose reductase
LKILLTGASGQVGYELQRSLQGLGEVVALDRSAMDLTDLPRVRDVVRSVKPDLIVNPAAYTAVDNAEADPKLAMRINAHAPAILAEEARKLGAALIHYSTDYVFDGEKEDPYTEEDTAVPINVYGRTKLAGEKAVQSEGISHLILRTGWVYGMRGRNFLLTVLRLAHERSELRIVNDQFGNPTWSRTIAEVTAHIVTRGFGDRDWWQEKSGLYHLTACGGTTWHGFAEAILENSTFAYKPAVTAIGTEEYPLLANRPRNAILACDSLGKLGFTVPNWRDALKLCLT